MSQRCDAADGALVADSVVVFLAIAVSPRDGAAPMAVADRLDGALRTAGIDLGGVSTHAHLRADFEGMHRDPALPARGGRAWRGGGRGRHRDDDARGCWSRPEKSGFSATLGASDRAVRRLLVAQGLAIAALGGVGGVLLSLPVAALLQRSLETGLLEAAVPSGFSWLGVAVWVPVALLIGAIGASLPARVA